MLILLPPSEGKTAPRRGKPLAPESLSYSSLAPTRTRVLDSLVELCAGDPATAAKVLGLGPTQLDLVARNGGLRTAPTGRADAVYTGVLYDALEPASLSAAGRRRAARRLAVTSALFGLLSPADRIPAYRLSGDATLPGVGPVAAQWRESLGPAVVEGVGRGLLVDLRSGMYAAFWRPGPELAPRTVGVRVLHEHRGVRKVVSHFNKATKGRIVRAVLEEGVTSRAPGAFADALRDLGWKVEEGEPTASGTRLDVVVDEV